MKRLAAALALLALALVTFFVYPGHTWLEQDTQIYVPILERLHDPGVLARDLIAQHPHVRFTIYDETLLAARWATGLDFRTVLQIEQVATRTLGIWGLFLCATALLAGAPRERVPDAPAALLIAAICSLGIQVTGPQVLTVEWEPTPRAFAVPLLLLGVGLAAHARWLAAGVAGACAFLYHPPTALPFWAVFAALLLIAPGKPGERRARAAGLLPLALAAALLACAAVFQIGDGEAQAFFTRLTPEQVRLQRMRAPYVWISIWWPTALWHHLIGFGLLAAAWARLRRAIPRELGWMLGGLALLGMLSMPASWLLLEGARWALVPQVQPLRMLLFVPLAAQFLTASAGVLAARRSRLPESAAWFGAAFLFSAQPVLTAAVPWNRAATVAALAVGAAAAVWLGTRPRFHWAPAAGLIAFFVLRAPGAMAAAQPADLPGLTALSGWARAATPVDAAFFFPDAGRAGYPGVFRAEALRAVYVDWKGGGQVNFLRSVALEWGDRWQRTGAGRYRPRNAPDYHALGIDYLVLRRENKLAGVASEWENERFAVYRTPRRP